MSRTGLAVGGVALIGLGAAIAFGWWWPSTAHATVQLDAPVRTVEVANDSGDVIIRAADVARATVRQSFHYSWGEPEKAYTASDGELVLHGCGSWCSVDYQVTVPRGTAIHGSLNSGELILTSVESVDVHVDSGDVSVSDVNGRVTVEADSGDVELRDVGGRVEVNADSGSVEGSGLSGPVRAQLSSGDLTLRLAEPADVRAAVNSGDITLTVPHVPYHVEGGTDSGDREIDVPRNSSSEHLLTLQTDSGDVTVHTPS